MDLYIFIYCQEAYKSGLRGFRGRGQLTNGQNKYVLKDLLMKKDVLNTVPSLVGVRNRHVMDMIGVLGDSRHGDKR